jgi:RimJ/RimL family protein N-acetyltransferase
MLRKLDVQPVTLEGDIVRLEPAEERHARDLAPFAQPDVFKYFVTHCPVAATEEAVADFIRGVRASPTILTFAIILKETGKPIGTTSYLDIRPEHLGLEIGMTWIAAPHQRTKVNPECKFLLLRHAFEVLGCQRVQIKTDGRNVQSQGAIEKLGATKEGVLRRHGQMRDGYMRDTVMYSILPEEWPIVAAALRARLQ